MFMITFLSFVSLSHNFILDVDCDRVWNPMPRFYIVQSKVRVKPRYRNQIDLFDCMQLCENDANCKSVDYYYGGKQCWMWSISMYDDMITRDYYAFRPNGNYDHWESYCKGMHLCLLELWTWNILSAIASIFTWEYQRFFIVCCLTQQVKWNSSPCKSLAIYNICI